MEEVSRKNSNLTRKWPGKSRIIVLSLMNFSASEYPATLDYSVKPYRNW